MSKKATVELLERLGILAISRYMNRRTPLILMYHRILKHDLVPGTHPDIFVQQIAYLKENFNIINMSQLLTHVQKKSVPERALVLTFDDGHYDFYANAWPIIKSHELTATLFVTTQFIDQQIWLWPDLLKYVLINASPREFNLDGICRLELSGKNILKIWNTLGDFCLKLSSEERLIFIKNLASDLRVNIPEAPQLPFSPTTWPQLAEMVAEGLDVGSHSVSHPILSHVTSEQLTRELNESRKRIRDMLKIDTIGICYPNGMPTDISPKVEDEARKIYNYGVVAYPKKFDSKNLMRIGRIGATNDIINFKVKTSYLSRAENIGEYK